jgi:hypothetical protein
MNLQFALGKFGRVGIRQNNEYPLEKFQGKERLGTSTEDLFKQKREDYGCNRVGCDEEE